MAEHGKDTPTSFELTTGKTSQNKQANEKQQNKTTHLPEAGGFAICSSDPCPQLLLSHQNNPAQEDGGGFVWPLTWEMEPVVTAQQCAGREMEPVATAQQCAGRFQLPHRASPAPCEAPLSFIWHKLCLPQRKE